MVGVGSKVVGVGSMVVTLAMLHALRSLHKLMASGTSCKYNLIATYLFNF